MRKFKHFLLTTLFLLFFSTASAQGDVRLASVSIALWPEYDRPAMLVIYRIKLSDQTPLPATLSFNIPSSVGKPSAIASGQADGSLVNLNYQQKVAGDWSTLTFQTATPDIQVEYYDSRLTKKGEARHFDYQWPGSYAVNSLVIEVQQPQGATAMRISPDLGAGKLGEDGLMYYRGQAGSLINGETFQIAVDYQKSGDTLSSASMPVYPSAPIDNSVPGRVTSLPALPWLLGGLGVLLIVGSGIWYWRTGRARPSSERHRGRRSSGRSPQPLNPDYVYCPRCGRRASAQDRFCRDCGTELRQ